MSNVRKETMMNERNDDEWKKWWWMKGTVMNERNGNIMNGEKPKISIEKKETKLNERKPTSMPFLQVSQNLEKKLNY